MPLVGCTLTPTSQLGSTLPTGTFDQGYLVGFLLFYSPAAGNLNCIFQVLGIICFLATWGRTVAILESPRRGINKFVYVSLAVMALISNVTITIGSILSYTAGNMMTYVDANLSLSQGALPSCTIISNRRWCIRHSKLVF